VGLVSLSSLQFYLSRAAVCRRTMLAAPKTVALLKLITRAHSRPRNKSKQRSNAVLIMVLHAVAMIQKTRDLTVTNHNRA